MSNINLNPQVHPLVSAGVIAGTVGGVTFAISPETAREWLRLVSDYILIAVIGVQGWWIFVSHKMNLDCLRRDAACSAKVEMLEKLFKECKDASPR